MQRRKIMKSQNWISKSSKFFTLACILYFLVTPKNLSANNTVEGAIQWAENEGIGDNDDDACQDKWTFKCLHFVGHCYLKNNAGYESPLEAWKSSDGFLGPQSTGPAPKGALIFYDNVPGYGHVGLSCGDGTMWHATTEHGTHEGVQHDSINRYGSLLGWRMPNGWIEERSPRILISTGPGIGIQGADITITAGSTVKYLTTDAQGHYFIPSTFTGNVNITIRKNGYKTLNKILNLTSPQSARKSALLQSSVSGYDELESSYVPSSISTRFQVGDRIRVTNTEIGLRGRYPNPGSTTYKVFADGDLGTIKGTAQIKNGYQYWQIQYDSYPSTLVWSAEGDPVVGENYLVAIAASKPSLVSPASNATNQPKTPTLSWNTVTGANSGYRVLVSSDPSLLPTDPLSNGSSGLDVNVLVSNGTNYPVPSGKLKSGTTYYWQVRGVGTNYYGKWSDQRCFTTAGSVSAQALTPSAYPYPSSYTKAQSVYLGSDTDGADVYYTTNGSEPSKSSTLYELMVPIQITQTTTIKAKAYKSGMTASNTWTGVYTIGSANTLSAPTFTPSAGTYTDSVRITIKGPSWANTRYTLDGSDPTEKHGTLYSRPFTISSTRTVKAFSYLSGWDSSSITSAKYTIAVEEKCSPPYFSVDPGDYPKAQWIAIECGTPHAVIRYTSGSTDPTPTSGVIYNSIIKVSSNQTIRAIAYLEGKPETKSAVVKGVFTITIPPPSATLAGSPTAINRTIKIGDNNPYDAFTVASTTGGDIQYSIESDSNWLWSGKHSGTATATPTSIQANYEMSLLTPGVYHGKLTIRDANINNKYVTEIPVNLTVKPFPSAIETNKNSISATITERSNAPSTSFTIRNSGGGTLSYAIGVDQTWLSVSPSRGENTGETDAFTVNYNASSLTEGTYTAHINITAAQGATKTIPVTLTVNPYGANIPVISGISPRIGSVEGGQRITIKGENLQNISSVKIDNTNTTGILSISSTELRLTTPAHDKIGKYDVVVKTSNGTTTCTQGYEYTYLRGNNIEELAHLGGWTSGLTVDGNYAYIQQGSSLTILNITNQATPTFMSNIRLPGAARAVAVSGNRAFIANSDMGLVVIDISDKANPKICGYHDTPGDAAHIKLLGGYAYLLDQNNSATTSTLRIYNILNPDEPSLVGTVKLPNTPWDLCLSTRSGSVFCYVATSHGMSLVDVTNPAAPVIRNNWYTSFVSYGIAAKGDYIYLGQNTTEGTTHPFLVLNIANADNPVLVGTATGGWCQNGLVVTSDNYVYFASSSMVKCFNVSNPALPKQAGLLEYTSDIISGQSVLSGSYIYTACGSYGLAAISLANPVSPSVVGSYKSSLGVTRGLHAFNNYVYMAYQNHGFRTIDVHDPTNPIICGEYVTDGNIQSMTDYNGYLYAVGDGKIGTKCFDVSDPNAIALKSSANEGTFFSIGSVAANGKLYGGGAWDPAWTYGLNVFNISNVSSIVFKNSANLPGNWLPGTMSISNSIACLPDINNGGAQFFDISTDPPTLRGYYDTSAKTYASCMSGATAYLADQENGLQIVNASNPDYPVGVGSFKAPRSVYALSRGSDGLVYISDGDVYAVDVTDPSNPSLWGSYITPGYCKDLRVVGDCIYIADGTGGFELLRKKDIVKPSILIMNPTTADSYTIKTNAISLAGSVEDNKAIAAVYWSSNRGGNGVASVSGNTWTISGIALVPGENVITVTAEDETGNTAFDTINVIYSPPDLIPPTVLSILNKDISPTSCTTVSWEVCFNETVTGVDAVDFQLTTTTTISGASVTGVSGSGTKRIVTVSTGTGDGTIRLDLKATGTGIKDLAANTISGGFKTGQSYTTDHTAPTAVSIFRSQASPTNSSSSTFDVRFSEDVKGFDLSDFNLVASGVTGAKLENIGGGGGTFVVTVNTGTGDGSIGLELKSSGTGIKDMAGNAITAGFAGGETYTIDKTAPVLTLSGSSLAQIEKGTIYGDAGVSASDAVDGIRSVDVEVSGLPLDTTVLGTRFVTYSVTDSAGNVGQAVRAIQVTPVRTRVKSQWQYYK